MRGFRRQRQTTAPAPDHARSLLDGEFADQFLANLTDRNWLFGRYGAYDGALKIPGSWRASTLLAGLVSRLPVDAYRDVRGYNGLPSRKVVVSPKPYLLADPCPGRYNPQTVMAAWVMDYLFHGNAIAVVADRDPLTGLPTAVLPIPARWVRVGWADGSMPTDLTGSHRVYEVGTWRGGPWDVIHVMGPCEPGALRGIGVLEAALSTFDLSRELMRQAHSISQHGVPTGTLETTDPDVEQSELETAKADWLAAQRDRTVAALPPSVKFVPMAWDPEKLQLVEARKFSLQEVALIFGLPGRYLGVESGSMQYSTPQLDSVDLLKLTVDGILVAFEQEFTRHLPPRQSAMFNREAILETDTKTRYETYGLALDPQKGWMTKNEVRALEDLPELDEFEAQPPAPAAPPADEGTLSEEEES